MVVVVGGWLFAIVDVGGCLLLLLSSSVFVVIVGGCCCWWLFAVVGGGGCLLLLLSRCALSGLFTIGVVHYRRCEFTIGVVNSLSALLIHYLRC